MKKILCLALCAATLASCNFTTKREQELVAKNDSLVAVLTEQNVALDEAMEAIAENAAIKVYLVGQEQKIKQELTKYTYNAEQIEIGDNTDIDETPMENIEQDIFDIYLHGIFHKPISKQQLRRKLYLYS